MVKDTTLYDRLNIQPSATSNEVEKAFKKLAKKYHPDKYDGPKEEGTRMFQEIQQAKEILLNNEKRELYDQIGMDMFKNNMDSDQGGGFRGHPGGDPFSHFGDIFGQGFPFNVNINGMGPRKRAPENIVEKLSVTLEQLYKEEVLTFNYKHNVICSKCEGEGSKDGKSVKCGLCGGSGHRVTVTRMGPMVQQTVGECSGCKGSGKNVSEDNKCETCKGKCVSTKEKTIQIPLKSGLTSGHKITLSGKGHHIEGVKTDLILVIDEKPHSVFKRIKDDLFIDVDLKLYQSLFGYDKIIKHLDGRKLHISCSGKTDVNTIRKISGEGMRSLNGNKGDLYIRFTMTLPALSSLPADTKTQLKTLLQTFDKVEVQQESQVLKTPDIVKTITNDCKQEQTNLLLTMLYNQNNTQQPRNNGHPQHFGPAPDFDMDSEEDGRQGCQQS